MQKRKHMEFHRISGGVQHPENMIVIRNRMEKMLRTHQSGVSWTLA
jgi:hypothetical protein